MQAKVRYLAIIGFTLFLFLVACGGEENTEEENTTPAAATEENDNEKEVETEVEEEIVDEVEEEMDTASVEEESDEEETDTDNSASDNEILNPLIGEETEGNVEVVFTNNNPEYVHDNEGFIIKVNKYQIVKVTDMNQSEEFRFNEDLEGYAVTADVTVENTMDENVYYLQVCESNWRISLTISHLIQEIIFQKTNYLRLETWTLKKVLNFRLEVKQTFI